MDTDQPFHLRFSFENEHPAPMDLVVEPWGEVHPLAPGATLVGEIRAAGAGELHVRVAPGRVTIYGWTGSAIEVDERA
jgi:hypothetical protein